MGKARHITHEWYDSFAAQDFIIFSYKSPKTNHLIWLYDFAKLRKKAYQMKATLNWRENYLKGKAR